MGDLSDPMVDLPKTMGDLLTPLVIFLTPCVTFLNLRVTFLTPWVTFLEPWVTFLTLLTLPTLLNHTCTRGPSVTRIMDFFKTHIGESALQPVLLMYKSIFLFCQALFIKNIVRLMQNIYISPEIFTQTLFVMFVTLIRSAQHRR